MTYFRDPEDYEAWLDRINGDDEAAQDEADRRADIERDERREDLELPEYPEG